MGAELWELMGGKAIWDEPWPHADARFLTSDTVELAVQINGKVRDRVVVAADASDEEVRTAAMASDKVLAHLEGLEVKKVVVVPGKLVSVVAAKA
jgi:leucyl-tRNA synthetase